MPVSAVIYATTDVVLDDREVRLLARDLVQFVPNYEFRVEAQGGRYPLTRVDFAALLIMPDRNRVSHLRRSRWNSGVLPCLRRASGQRKGPGNMGED